MKLLIYWSVYLILPCIAEENINVGNRQVDTDNDCKSITVTFESKEKATNVHLPDSGSCLGFVIDQTKDGKCDGKTFPMTCTFYTVDERPKISQEAKEFYVPVKNKYMDTSRINDRVERSLISDGQHLNSENGKTSSQGRKKKRGKKDAQYEWVAEAALKIAESVFEDGCKPSHQGRRMRHVDCDMCWVLFVPHPCKCDCRGWQDMFGVPGMCMSRCSNDYRKDTKYYCWKPCDRDGQLALNKGCGLTPVDRTCENSSGDCVWKYAQVVMSFAEVITFFVSLGTSSAFTKAGKAALKAGSKKLLKKGLSSAVRKAAKEMAQQLGKNKEIRKALKKYGKEKQEELLEGGAELFLVSSMGSDPDYGDIALDIAETLDPSGLVGLGRQFIPPEKCDDMVYMKPFPDEDPNLPDLDVLHAIDDEEEDQQWYVGDAGKSCGESCKRRGLTCLTNKPTTTISQLKDRLDNAGVKNPKIASWPTALALNPAYLNDHGNMWHLGTVAPTCEAKYKQRSGLCNCNHWYVGDPGKSCGESCKSRGLTCRTNRRTTTVSQLKERLDDAGVKNPKIASWPTALALNPAYLNDHGNMWHLGTVAPTCGAKYKQRSGLCDCT